MSCRIGWMTDFFFNLLGCGHTHPEERNGTGLWQAARGVNTLRFTFNKWLPSIEAKSSGPGPSVLNTSQRAEHEQDRPNAHMLHSRARHVPNELTLAMFILDHEWPTPQQCLLQPPLALSHHQLGITHSPRGG